MVSDCPSDCPSVCTVSLALRFAYCVIKHSIVVKIVINMQLLFKRCYLSYIVLFFVLYVDIEYCMFYIVCCILYVVCCNIVCRTSYIEYCILHIGYCILYSIFVHCTCTYIILYFAL